MRRKGTKGCVVLSIEAVWLLGFVFLSPCALSQGVKSVSFETTYDDMIEVKYYLLTEEDNPVHNVRIFVSEDGGFSFFEARSVTGDVGNVDGSGWRFARWDVLNDRESLETTRCVVKVVASGTRGIGDFVSDVFLGSSGMRRQNDGWTMWGGWNIQRFKNLEFKQAVSAENIQTEAGYNAGLRYVSLPFVVDAMYGHEEYKVTGLTAPDATIELHSLTFGVSAAVLPVIPYVVPTVGAGYQVSWLEASAGGTGDKIPTASISSPFWQVGLNIPLTPGLVIGGNYRDSVPIESLSKGTGRGWYQWSLSAGFHFGNP